MNLFQSLRTRLLLSYLLVMEVTLICLGSALYFGFRHLLYQQLDQKLWTLAQMAAPSLSQVKEQGAKPLAYLEREATIPNIEWLDNRGQQLAIQGQLDISGGVPEVGFVTLPAQPFPIRRFTLAISIAGANWQQRPLEGYIRVSQSTAEVERLLSQLRWQLAAGILFSLIVVLLEGFWLTQKATEPAEQSFSLLKQFTADASHELRNPLTAIKASLDILRHHPERIHAKDVKKIAAIASATNEMIRLTEDLLFLARNEGAALAVRSQWEAVSLNLLLDNLVELLAPTAAAKDIALKYRERAAASVLGDEAQLSRLFSNLVNNAIQYTPEGGCVSLTLFQEQRFACIAVEDTGIGIAAGDLPQIFNRFWRADKARSRREGGTGLGLSIVRAIVERHGGKIVANSQIGVGTCFQVTLPLHL